MPAGYVLTVKLDRNFGFIAVDGGPDVFFHRGALDPELEFDASLQDRRVELTIVHTPKGPAARDVRPAR